MESLFDFSGADWEGELALGEQVAVGGHRLTIQVSGVHRYEDYGPHVDVVRVRVLRRDGEVLTLRDLQPAVSRQEAYRLWGYLCEQLMAAARLTYGLATSDDTNPSLGCWGPRADWVEAGVDDDSATGLMVGLAIDTEKASRTGRNDLLALAVRSAVVASLREWAGTPGSLKQISPRFSRN